MDKMLAAGVFKAKCLRLLDEVAVQRAPIVIGFRSDPADLIIVATARITGTTLLTRDRRILDYAAAGHVNAIAA